MVSTWFSMGSCTLRRRDRVLYLCSYGNLGVPVAFLCAEGGMGSMSLGIMWGAC